MDLSSIQLEYPNRWQETPGDLKTICIIGAGAGGLAILKVILDSLQYKAGLWKPKVFESRDTLGGVWVPAAPTADPPLTPLYDSLTTNLPHPVMAFTSYSFPPSTPVFPHASTVQKYLRDYADHFHLTPHIQLKTDVRTVERDASKWKVLLSSGQVLYFDFVVVSNGHYRVPRYPNTPGIAKWLSTGRATHSAWYRRPHTLGDTILVVGAGPSGQDISTEMRTVARTVIHSMTGGIKTDIGNLRRRARVAEFGDDGQVLFEDGSIEYGIDHCILATGYEFSFPFFSNGIINPEVPPPAPPLPHRMYNSSYSVFPLAKHMFPLQASFPLSSLAFVGLLVRVAPFPLMEAQARAVVHAFSHPEALDGTQEAVDVITRYEELRAEFGDNQLSISKAWHRFQSHEQFYYRDRLYEFAGCDGTEEPGQRYMKVPEWEKQMYEKKDVLRKVWVELEKNGEAERWVQGIGENGPQEWIDLLRRMLKRAEEIGLEVEEIDRSKL